MAAAHSLDDDISCSICLTVFKRPRSLPCGHTFCRKCLQRHIDANVTDDDTFGCPLCRHEICIPDPTEPEKDWAKQFPVNVALQSAISAIRQLEPREVPATQKVTDPDKHTMRLVCDTLKLYVKFLQGRMKSDIERLERCVDVSAAVAVDGIDRKVDELIEMYTAAIHKEQAKMKKRLETSRLSLDREIFNLFSQHREIIDDAKRMIDMGEHLLTSGKESDIQYNIPKFAQMQQEISDFVNAVRSKSKIPDLQIVFTEVETSDKLSVDIGEITDAEHLVRTLLQRDRQANRMTDTLIHARTLITNLTSDLESPLVKSILVLEGKGQNASKIIVSDWNNRCVKWFNSKTSALRYTFRLPGPPRGLAKSCDEQVVVVLPRQKQIVYLNVQDDVTLTKTLTTEKEYIYVTMLPGNRLAVSGWDSMFGDGSIDLLDDGGRVIRSLRRDLIPCPRYLVAKGLSLVVVSRKLQSLVCVTPSGVILWTSRDSAWLRSPIGVACDVEEFVYVCDDKRNCVVQLSRDGKFVRDIITHQGELSKPQFVCCDRDNLYVVQSNGKVKIFTWSKCEE
ncbi:uncharacterized protein LOC121378082 [Gigantopelta aegis]|uniref:uncharacterized protein LOC121378082 n=1 Tax=Gigantopelta aegis TaxID=1735272 RepID=UPI001B88AA2A|nr:uncharacterized protein LOC121378082 [Gigantopelta aegis]